MIEVKEYILYILRSKNTDIYFSWNKSLMDDPSPSSDKFVIDLDSPFISTVVMFSFGSKFPVKYNLNLKYIVNVWNVVLLNTTLPLKFNSFLKSNCALGFRQNPLVFLRDGIGAEFTRVVAKLDKTWCRKQ